ncbi:Anti-sigma-K factor rskA [Paenibacillus sp. UNC496MF]|uniref:anti-sigma factor n=1 Tax=Paenibacillus sp. UNC496MF TaxID=1502753 RepID=UPI0008E6EABF|nr:anti-sigma factor [Paenibacillus sp. UNC496MF]SFJ12077.1 Anti-sigma-K factor rskA [Paenibacillus sp. UNC496MF]
MSAAPRYSEDACSRRYREEDWIDWLLGGKQDAEREAMAAHLAGCARCREARAAWAPLLAGAAPEPGAPGVAGEANGGPEEPGRARASRDAVDASAPRAAEAASGGGRARAAGAPGPALPSETLRRRLRLYVRLRASALRVRRALRPHRRTAAAVAAIAVLLLCATGLYRHGPSPAEQRKVDAAVLEPAAASFLDDPQTAGFEVRPELEQLGEGYIWFNDASGEVYVMLEGLLPSDGHDVQVWAVNGEGRVNLGLLHHDRPSRAHLFVKEALLMKAHHIALTVEPAGGSRMPTEPDVFVFRLQRG